VKLLVIVDLFGQENAGAGKPTGSAVSGLRDADVKPVSQGFVSPRKIKMGSFG
jgi:hypothetical protein